MQRDLAYNRMKLIREEYEAARFAVRAALLSMAHLPTVRTTQADRGISYGEIARCSHLLEPTYIVRLFAEFEGILRDFWRGALRRRTKPPMEILMDRIADANGANRKDRDSAHHVREYRNFIIHKDRPVPPLTFQECLSRLNCYLRWFPPQW